MTSAEYLSSATNLLKSHNIETARLDSLLLMEFILGMDKAKLLANPDMLLTTYQLKSLDKVIKKRLKHTPISYITQRTEFYGRNFFINSSVLEPRPESETMINLFIALMRTDKELLKRMDRQGYVIVGDIGTGSGALGITAKLESDNVLVDLIDIDQGALNVAKRNVVLHTIDANVIRADLLPSTSVKYDLLLCNLPYIPDSFSINLAATHEPPIAIFGGKDGLDIYRKLFKLLRYQQHIPLYILIEALPSSHKKLASIAKLYGYNLKSTDDFIQVYKVAS